MLEEAKAGDACSKCRADKRQKTKKGPFPPNRRVKYLRRPLLISQSFLLSTQLFAGLCNDVWARNIFGNDSAQLREDRRNGNWEAIG